MNSVMGPPRPVVFGRNASCDVRFTSHSVSSTHAKVHFCNNNFYLTDCQSSTGTHVFMRRPTELKANEEHIFRIGGTNIKLKREGSMKFARLNPLAKFLEVERNTVGSDKKETGVNVGGGGGETHRQPS